MISIIDGGINNPKVPEPAKLPNNSFSGYFLFLNSGIDIFPTVATVAAEDPDIAANNAHPTTFTCTKPPGNFDNQGDKPLNKFSDKHTIIMGINTEKIENNSLKIYNSMVVLDNELNLLYEYNKNKLVPFGEFLPLEKYLGKIGLKKVTQGYQSFSSGNSRELIFIDDKKFNFIPLICYEIIYSGKIYPILDDTSFIINISEDGWFGNSIGPYQHFSHSIFRAIEEGKNVIRASNNGISAFIDSNGIIVNKKESTEKGVIEVNNYKDVKRTLFSKFGNKIFFYFIIFYISLFFLVYKKEG